MTNLPSCKITLLAAALLAMHAVAAEPGAPNPPSAGGTNPLVWRTSTYFAIGSSNASCDSLGSRPVAKDHNFLQSWKVTQPAKRFRLWFCNGAQGNTGTAFTLSGATEVPGGIFLPWTFDGKPSFSVPAGGGAIFCTDWQEAPMAANDLFYTKGYCSNDGAGFDMPTFSSPITESYANPSGTFDSGQDELGKDASGIAMGTGPWAAAHYVKGMFRCVMIETDSLNADRLPSVDIWGDSIGAGTMSIPWVTQVVLASGNPMANLCVHGQNQTQIPKLAMVRAQMARGEIAICEHGRNSSDTAALAALWKYLRGLGYKKIIQTRPSDYIGKGNVLPSQSGSAAIRAFIDASVKVGDGPDAVWDFYGIAQPQGVWVDGWSKDMLHPTVEGDKGIANAGIAAGWTKDLK